MVQAGAVAQAVYTQGSCAWQGVSMDTDRGCGKVVQGTATAVAVTAATEAGTQGYGSETGVQARAMETRLLLRQRLVGL